MSKLKGLEDRSYASISFFIFLISVLLFSIPAKAADIDEEKYLKTEIVLKELLAKKAYKVLYKKAVKAIKSFPKKSYPYYCAAEVAFQLKDDLKFKKKNKKPLELVRKYLTEAKKCDKDGKVGTDFISLLESYQKKIYDDGLKLQKDGFTKGDLHFNSIYKLFDNSNATYTSLYNSYQDLPDSNYSYKEYNHPRYRICNTAKNVTYMTEEEKRMLYFMNLIRMDPSTFYKVFLQAYKKDRKLNDTDEYFSSLMRDVSTASPCKELLLPHEKLYNAATFHALDMGKTGKAGHESSDATDPFKRIERFLDKSGAMAENCQYGSSNPVAVVMQLMIDEGVSSLGHRKTIMNCSYKNVGIAQRAHVTYGSNTVMDFIY